VITVEVVLAGIDVPTPHLIAIHAIEVLFAHKRTPVVLGQVRAICLLPRLVLHIRRVQVFRQCGQFIVFDGRAAARERCVIEPPQRAELAQGRQCAIDKVLVRARQIVVNHPVEIPLFGGEFDIDPIRA
jgi:hypothetical protein